MNELYAIIQKGVFPELGLPQMIQHIPNFIDNFSIEPPMVTWGYPVLPWKITSSQARPASMETWPASMSRRFQRQRDEMSSIIETCGNDICKKNCRLASCKLSITTENQPFSTCFF